MLNTVKIYRADVSSVSPLSEHKDVCYVWYSMEKLVGDLLTGLKLVKLLILPMLFILFV